MSIYEVTKGTELEKDIDQFFEAELRGVGMYHALAFLAKEKGLDDVVETLETLAEDEGRHAGLYMVLNGRVPQDIFAVLSQASKIERDSKPKIKEFAQRVRGLGHEKAAEEIEAAAEDEGHHGDVLAYLLKKYNIQ
jgi:rubrerythrin